MPKFLIVFIFFLGMSFSCKPSHQNSDSSTKSRECDDYPGCFQTQRYPEPSPIEFSPQSPMCKLWKKAHNHLPPDEQKVIHTLVDTLDYVSIEEFDQEMIKHVRKLKEVLGTDEAFAIVDRNKSSEWLASRILNHERYRDLNFKFQLVDANKLGVFLGYRKEKGLKTNVVRFDDASYSGTQMVRYIGDFRLANSAYRDDLAKLYIVLPYFTQAAQHLIQRRIPHSYEKTIAFFPHNIPDDLSQESMKSLASILKEHNIYDTFVKLYPNSKDYLIGFSHTVFQHKAADFLSVFIDFIRGGAIVKRREEHIRSNEPNVPWLRLMIFNQISHFKRSSNHLPFQIPCVPYITPPYKETFKDRDYYHVQTLLDNYEHLEQIPKRPYIGSKPITLDDLKIWKKEQDRFVACLKACPDDGQDCQCDTKIKVLDSIERK